MQDEYWGTPQGTFEERRQAYLAFCASDSPKGGTRNGFFSQIARLELGLPVDEASIREGIAFVDSRRDCCDFAVGGLLRILYLYNESPNISQDLIVDIEACLLRFKYWWDEPKGDNDRCYHTENHQIIFHSDELLAGQRFKDQVFSNNDKDGRYHIEHALHLIRRWLDFRVRFGYSEWLSHCYLRRIFSGSSTCTTSPRTLRFAARPSCRSTSSSLRWRCTPTAGSLAPRTGGPTRS